MIYVTSVTAAQGSRAGVISALGLSGGIVCHVIAAALGVATLIAASPSLFLVLKLAGAGYLVYLGIGMLRGNAGGKIPARAPIQSVDLKKVFWRGVMVDLLNPKIGVFFVAFLPQFIHPLGSSSMSQIFPLGVIFIMYGFIINTSLALLSGSLFKRMKGKGFSSIRRWVPGGILIFLGISVALGKSLHRQQ